MRLGGVVDTSTIDWYGNVSLVVFFAGCNFRCPYCHNSGLIPLDSGESLGAEYLRARLEKEKNLLDSIVLSGGEPLLQPEGIRTVCSLAKEAGNVPAMVKRSLEICNEWGVEVEARTTIAPGLSDEPGFIKVISEDIRDLCGLSVLQQFDNMGEVLRQDLKSKKPPTKEKLIDLAGVASEAGIKNVYIRTRRTGLERIR